MTLRSLSPAPFGFLHLATEGAAAATGASGAGSPTPSATEAAKPPNPSLLPLLRAVAAVCALFTLPEARVAASPVFLGRAAAAAVSSSDWRP